MSESKLRAELSAGDGKGNDPRGSEYVNSAADALSQFERKEIELAGLKDPELEMGLDEWDALRARGGLICIVKDTESETATRICGINLTAKDYFNALGELAEAAIKIRGDIIQSLRKEEEGK